MDLCHACMVTGRRGFKFLWVKNTEKKTGSRAARRREENIESLGEGPRQRVHQSINMLVVLEIKPEKLY